MGAPLLDSGELRGCEMLSKLVLDNALRPQQEQPAMSPNTPALGVGNK
jgi:hypothetical protein